MPIYEYQCQACGHKLEKLQKLSDVLLKDCPECDEPELSKQISAVAFRLKGSGWYETDFKTGDKKNVSSSDNSSNSSSSTGDSSSSKKSDSNGSSSKSSSSSKDSSNSSSKGASSGNSKGSSKSTSSSSS